MTIYYAVLALLTAAVAAIVISAGHDEKAQPSIAGGYDAATPVACLGAPPPKPTGAPLPPTAPGQPAVNGPSFDVKQSGEFVNFTNSQNTLGGKLRLGKDGKLTGDVKCVNGKSAHFTGVAIAGKQGVIRGTLDGGPVLANLRRDPPEPGTPKPRAPGSIAGIYKLSPRPTCFGGSFELHGSGSAYTVSAKTGDLGKVAYNDKTGLITGDLACKRGGHLRFKATAVGRHLNNATAIPLEVGSPLPAAPGTKPALTTPSGLPPAGE